MLVQPSSAQAASQVPSTMQRLYMYDAAEASKQAEQVWFQARLQLVTATALGAREQYIKMCTVYVTENTLP